MSFGRVFLDESYVSPEADIGKVHDRLLDAEIRSSIKAPNPHLHKLSQEASRLFAAGVQSDIVKDNVKSQIIREKAAKRPGGSVKAPRSDSLGSITKVASLDIHPPSDAMKPSHVLSLSAALARDDRREGGKYHPPHIVDNYETYFQVRNYCAQRCFHEE